MRIFNIEEGIVRTIQSLYASPGSSVLLDGEVGERFPSTEGVHEGRGLWYGEEDLGIQNNMLLETVTKLLQRTDDQRIYS